VPTAAELQAGVEFLVDEPMRQYEDRKAKELKDAKDAEEKKKAGETPMVGAETKPPAGPVLVAPPAADGMMAGVTPGAAAAKDEKDKKPVTAFGRYIKILLSSNEFLFLN
jgi:hypothetical protein